MSIIAILGTALAIMMIMAIIVSEEVKTISIAPETNRYRTYFVNGYAERDTVIQSMNANGGGIDYKYIHTYLKELKTPEYLSVYSNYPFLTNVIVNMTGDKELYALNVRTTDAAYWQLYSIPFVKGRPYTKEEFESGMPYAVINESEARNLFKGEEAIGKTLEVYKKEYQVIGVVKDVSMLFTQAFSKIWIPYTSIPKYEESSYLAAIVAKSPKDYAAISAEMRNMEYTYGTENKPKTLYMIGPHNHQTFVSNVQGYSKDEVEEFVKVMQRKRLFILIILLLVPALNLSGISLSRIKKRTTEIGVRKAFGAKRYVILMQVLYENFITSLIGGVLGLILSYVVVFQMKKWLLNLPPDASVPLNTLISPVTFIAVFLVCLILNLLSAGLPAFRASRVSIINSINQNEKNS